MASNYKILKYDITWSVGRVNLMILESGARIVGNADDEKRWMFELDPKVFVEGENQDFIGAYLRMSKREFNGDIKYSFQIKDEAGNLLFENGCAEWEKTMTSRILGIPEFIKKKDLFDDRNHYIQDDVLRLSCQVEVKEEPQSKVPAIQLQQHLLAMFESEELSDCLIKCQGTEFQCSKFMLAARSAVFKAMLTADMKEAKTGEIEIHGYSPNAVKQVLKFIYTGSTYQFDEETVVDVVGAANEYSLDRLKKMCEEGIAENLTLNNVTKYLSLAEKYSLSDLRVAIGTFFKNCKGNELADIVVKLLDMKTVEGPSLVE